MVTWTIRVDKRLDSLVDENIRALGYTSKAELVREAVRSFVLEKNALRLGLSTLERERSNSNELSAEQALQRLRSITKDKEFVSKILKEERQLIEDALLRITGE